VTADGKLFYFSSRVDDKPRLFRSTVDGSDVKRALDDDSFDVESSVSPDGNWIAYSSTATDGRSVQHTLRKAPVNGGEFLQLTKGNASNPHYSPDGTLLSYVNGESIGVIDASDGKLVGTFPTQKHALLHIGARWMPDGKSVAYLVRQGLVSNIWRQPLDGSAPVPLTDFPNGEIYYFAFSVDGRKLIVARGYPTQDAMLLKVGR
jgi:Tol biopolymer transport system component